MNTVWVVIEGKVKSQCDCAAAYDHWLAANRNDVGSRVAVPIAAVMVNYR